MARLKRINYILWWFGVQLVPRPPSVKSLIEYSNSVEVMRPMGPSAAHWLRSCARAVAVTDSDRNSDTVRLFLTEGR